MSGIYWANPDKEQHHAALSTSVPPHPARIGFFGAPGSGKRSLALNILVSIQQSNRPFDGTITVVHLDPDTEEYSVLDDHPGGFSMRSCYEEGLPNVTDFNRDKKNLLILDELPFLMFGRVEKTNLDRLFNYCSTHCSLTILVMAQDAFSVPISVRRSLTHVCLWPSPVKSTNAHYSRMLGVNINDIQKAFCKSRHDCICLDLTGDGPTLRLNWSQPIQKAS